jgi:co-chaperonin GroES (HSP10)
MSVYNPTNPPLFLTGAISQISSNETYSYIDDSGLAAAGAKISYNVVVSNISSQSIGTSSTRSGGAKEYTAIDIKTGDWIASENGQVCLQIVSVSSKSNDSISFIAKDIDMISYKTYGNNSISNGSNVCFFELSDNGQPLITTSGISFFTSPASIDKVQGRFIAVEETERYRLEYSSNQSQVDVGDTVTVSTTDGSLVKLNSTNASPIPLGIVLEKSMGGTVVYVKPFNTIVDNYSSPERLTANAGEIYYSDPNNPGEMTTVQNSGSIALFLQIRDAIPTVVETTVSNYLPTVNDSLIINNVEVFLGGTDAVPANTDELIQYINDDTALHFVTASKNSVYSSTVTGDGTGPTNGETIVTISDNGGISYISLDVTIGDGTNSTTITFDENTGETLLDLGPAFGAPGYLAFTAVEIANVLNSAFTANGINLVAESFDGGTVLPHLKISATNASASIQISGTDTDILGDTFLTGTGLAASTVASSFDYLVLTRIDGGDIQITASKGSYINVNGLTSSSLGSPAVLLMTEGVGDSGVTTVGISTDDDLDQVPNVTSSNGDATGVFITHTPFGDGLVQITVNGLGVNLGDGVTTSSCYFSADGGITARNIADIEGGDQLYWNGSIAGYQLDGGDLVDVIYDKPSS